MRDGARDKPAMFESAADRREFFAGCRLDLRELNREDWANRVTWATVRGPLTPKSQLPKCGARTRAGGQCRAPAWRTIVTPSGLTARLGKPLNGRCRMHGGKSTGPRTPEGKARCADAARRNLVIANVARRAALELREAPRLPAAVSPAPAAPAPQLTPEQQRAADTAEHIAAIAAGRPSPFRFRDDAGNWRR